MFKIFFLIYAFTPDVQIRQGWQTSFLLSGSNLEATKTSRLFSILATKLLSIEFHSSIECLFDSIFVCFRPKGSFIFSTTQFLNICDPLIIKLFITTLVHTVVTKYLTLLKPWTISNKNNLESFFLGIS